MSWLLDFIFGEQLAQQTSQYLAQLSSRSLEASRRSITQLLMRFRQAAEPKLRLGQTDWQEFVDIPVSQLLRAQGLITGGMGSGKSMLGLLIIKQLIDLAGDDD
jgi:hypothetical protein